MIPWGWPCRLFGNPRHRSAASITLRSSLSDSIITAASSLRLHKTLNLLRECFIQSAARWPWSSWSVFGRHGVPRSGTMYRSTFTLPTNFATAIQPMSVQDFVFAIAVKWNVAELFEATSKGLIHGGVSTLNILSINTTIMVLIKV